MSPPKQPSVHQRRAMLAAELARRRQAIDSIDLSQGLFDWQMKVWQDESRTVDVLGSRRSGKSTVVSRRLIHLAARSPHRNFLFPYIAQSQKNAKLIIWHEVLDTVRRHKLRVHVNNSDLTIRFLHNGNTFMLGGCNDRSQIARFYGLRMGACAIDECHTMPWLEELEDTIRPSLMDVAGPLYRLGNPDIVLGGPWFRYTGPHRGLAPCSMPGFHAWTLFENPTIPLAHEEAFREKAEKGWSDDHPRWLTGYRGQHAHDPETTAFPYDSKWDVDALPLPSGWRYVLCIDVGHVDANAYVIWAAHDNVPGEFILEARKVSGQLVDQFVADVRAYRDRYPNLSVVVDSGGMGKQHWAELSRRGVSCFPAEKRDKESATSVLHDRILGGHVHVLRGRATDALRDEWAVLRRKENSWQLEDDQEDHAAHAALYGHRHLRKYLYEPLERLPEPWSREAYEREAAQLREKRRLQIVRPGRPAYDQ